MMIFGQSIPKKQSMRNSFLKHGLLWSLLLLTVFLDYFSTVYFMVFDGVDTEANVVIRWLASEIGVMTGVLIGKGLQIIAALGFVSLSQKLARAVLLLLVLLNALAVLNNLF